MQRLLKRDLIYVVLNQIVLSAGSALIVILLARFTDQVTFGEIRYLIAVLAILAFSSLPGISTIINHQASDMTRADLIHLVKMQLRWGIGALAGAMLVAYFYAFTDQFELARAFIIGGILAPIANLYLVPGFILAGTHHFKLKTAIDAFIMSSILIGAALGALLFVNVSGIIAFYLGIQAVATILGLLVVTFVLPKNGNIVQKRIEERSLTEGKQLTFLQIPFSLIPAMEKAVIFLILGPISLAIFVIAVLPVEHFKTAFRNLMQFYMLPYLAGRDMQSLLHWFATGVFILTLGIGALMLFIMYGMPLLFENFNEARNFSLLLVLSALPLPIHVITINWIAKRRMQTLGIFAALSVVTNIILIGANAYLFGLTGAIVAKIFYEIVLAAGLLHLESRRRPPKETPSVLQP